MRNPCPLTEAFLADHRVLTRGLAELHSAVDREIGPLARQLAAQLDRDAGPHIEFEEMSFYPKLIQTLGSEFVTRLYREHDSGRRALEQLRDADDQEIPWDELRELLSVAMDHVQSCGTLTSHVASFDEDERGDLLVELTEARQRATKWTAIDRTSRVVLPANTTH